MEHVEHSRKPPKRMNSPHGPVISFLFKDVNESNGTNDSNDSNYSGFIVDPGLGPPMKVPEIAPAIREKEPKSKHTLSEILITEIDAPFYHFQLKFVTG